METIALEWRGGTRFELQETPPARTLGARHLMLLALGKCSASTALALMGRMRLDITRLRLEVWGRLSDDARRETAVFLSFHQVFRIECTEREEAGRIARAVELALSRYCGVSLMLEMIAPLSYELYVNREALVPEEAGA